MFRMTFGLLIFAFAITTQAQDGTTTGRPIQERMSMMGMTSSGFRLGISKGLINGRDEDSSTQTNTISYDGDVRNDFGASLGYAYLPSEELGFLGRVAYQSYDGGNIGATRADVNLAYSFYEKFYIFGGGNLNKFATGAKDIRDFNTGAGWQAGMGFQVNSILGFDVQYVETRNSRSLSRSGTQGNTELRLSGLEFVAHATF